MSLDEYLLGLLAIISGLAITDMVGGLHRLLAHRRNVKWHWLTPLAALYVAYLILASWWVSWLSFHGHSERAMLGWFLVPVGQLICLFLAGRGVLPDEISTSDAPALDLEKFYYSTKRYVWGALAANSVLLLVARGHALKVGGRDTPGMALTVWTILFGLAYYLALAIIDNRWFHRIAVPLACVILFSLTSGQVIVS